MLAIAAVVIGSLLPSQDLPSVDVDDKLQHFVAYAALSAGAVQLFARRLSWGFVCVLLVLMGIGLATAFTPLRDVLLRFDRRL